MFGIRIHYTNLPPPSPIASVGVIPTELIPTSRGLLLTYKGLASLKVSRGAGCTVKHCVAEGGD